MMADTFKLPGSSYDELVKIIKAYSTGKVGQPMSLDIISQTIGMDKTIVSRNNGFLVQLGLVSEGNKKSPTEIGQALGRAYNLNMINEVTKIWRDIIENNEFLTRMLSAIKIRQGMDKSSFINHILYSSGLNPNNNSKAGANTIIEIYKAAGLVTDNDGQISVLDNHTIGAEISVSNHTHEQLHSSNNQSVLPISPQVIATTSNSYANINININIDAKVNEIDDLANKINNLLNQLRS